METSQLVTLSTAHIKESTADILDNPDTTPITVYPTPYGYFVHTQSIDQNTLEDLNKNSHDLYTCIQFARLNSFAWIQFDRDAEPISELPTYVWNNDTKTTQKPPIRRISKKEYYLNIATAVSKRSTCLRRHYGAVIVNNDEIIATGYNGSTRGAKNCCDKYDICPRHNKPHNSGDYSDCHSVHAEQNALLSAARNELQNAVLYLNGEEYDPNNNLIPLTECEPCPICMRMIINAGIKTVITPTTTLRLRL